MLDEGAKMKRTPIITLGVASLLSALFLLMHGGIGVRRAIGAGRAAGMTDLKNLDQLQQAFVNGQGKVRVVALLSPV